MSEPTGDMEAVIQAAREGVPVQSIGDNLFYIPQTGEFRSLEQYLSAPRRKRGVVQVFDVASFNQVIADNAGGDCSIYIDRDAKAPALSAILNGNGKQGAGWGDHRVDLVFRKTTQWQKWESINGKMLAQTDFAEFVEENMADISNPPGAVMLEIVTYLEVTRAVAFKSALRLDSGVVQFQNIESDDAKVSRGVMAIPECFTLSIAPYQGAPAYLIPARFRYRLVEGKLTLGLKLQRVEDMVLSIFEDIVAKIERGTNISVLDGRPPETVAST